MPASPWAPLSCSIIVFEAAEFWVLEGDTACVKSLWALADCDDCWVSLPKMGVIT